MLALSWSIRELSDLRAEMQVGAPHCITCPQEIGHSVGKVKRDLFQDCSTYVLPGELVDVEGVLLLLLLLPDPFRSDCSLLCLLAGDQRALY